MNIRLWNRKGSDMQGKTSKNQDNNLKNIDFLAWQVGQAKTRHRDREITRIMSDRPRQRSADHLN